MARAPKEGMRFTKVYLENWRNFAKIDVDLPSRVFLVGPNASGKSNLLDVFRFLRDIASVGGGLQEAVRRRLGVSSLRALTARAKSDIAVRVCIGSDGHPAAWEYELRFNQDSQKRPVIKKERVAKDGADLIVRPDDKDREDKERLTQTYLEQVTANKEFREVSDFFAAVRYLHIVPQLIREPDRSVGKSNDPFGGDFLEQVARTASKTRDARLHRIRDALRVAVPQLMELEPYRDNRGVPHLRGKYTNWRAKGVWLTEEQFSDGTLRLMGLLWAVLDGTGPLLLEEPELSLHPGVVRFIPPMFSRVQRSRAGRQVLVSTHSPDLLQDEGIGLDEVLLLSPDVNGTSVKPAGQFEEIVALLEGGLSMAEAVMPKTTPTDVQQLAMFGADLR